MHTRFPLVALLGGAALAGGLADATVTAASATRCTPQVSAIGGRRAIVYCGPATVSVAIGGRTYRFRNGLCTRSATMGAVELSVGTLVQGAAGNAGRPFVSLIIAQTPSRSEALEALVRGRRLFPDSPITLSGNLLSRGTFTTILAPAFSGSWDCHGVIVSGP